MPTTAVGLYGGAPAIAFDIEFEDGGPMHEPVDGRQRHGLFGEDRAPLAERLIGGDKQGAVLVSGADQFEQDAGFGLVFADIGDVVEDEQVVFVQLADGGLKGQFAACDLEPLHQVGSARVQDAEAVFDERQADRGGQVTLAGAGRADQDQVGALVEPAVPGDQGVDMGLGDHGHDVEVEVGQGFSGRQFGLGEMAFEAAPGPLGDLLFGQRAEQTGGWPALGIGAFGESRPRRLEGGQAQFGEHEIELWSIHGAHERSPASVVRAPGTGGVSKTS